MSFRYQRIAALAEDYPIGQLCAALAVSRSGYHAWARREPSARQLANEKLLAEIGDLRQGMEVCYGSPRMTVELQARGHVCSVNRVGAAP